jgi:hypothetical protein
MDTAANAPIVTVPTDLRHYVLLTLAFLFRQGAPSAYTLPNDTVSCRYRMEDDAGNTRMCAAGAWLPDAKYTPLMEGQTVSSEEWRDEFPTPFGRPVLVTLQYVHDRAADTALHWAWRAALISSASRDLFRIFPDVLVRKAIIEDAIKLADSGETI